MRTLLAFALVAAGCTGEITELGSRDPSPDASSTMGGSGGGSGSGAPAGPGSDAGAGAGSGTAPACKTIVTANLASGHHNPGRDCLSCHNGSTASKFTLGGTLYKVGGTTAQAGGTITVVDANNVSVDLVSGTNGNFYTSQTFAFPVKVTASACPSTLGMSTQVTAAGGGCAMAGCHVSGSQGAIHL